MIVGLFSRLQGAQFSSKHIDFSSEERACLGLYFHTQIPSITHMFDKIQENFNKYPFSCFQQKLPKELHMTIYRYLIHPGNSDVIQNSRIQLSMLYEDTFDLNY